MRLTESLRSRRHASMKELREGGVAVLYSTGTDGRCFVGGGKFLSAAATHNG
ncbi:MAG: hypothetical protein QXY84_05380 [Candidatus Caldarchaeum sp.]